MTPKMRSSALRDRCSGSPRVIRCPAAGEFGWRLCTARRFSFKRPTIHTSGGMVPGSACSDAPVRDVSGQPGWLPDHLGGDFVVMSFGSRRRSARTCVRWSLLPAAGVETLCDERPRRPALRGCDGAYLIRPISTWRRVLSSRRTRLRARWREKACSEKWAAFRYEHV